MGSASTVGKPDGYAEPRRKGHQMMLAVSALDPTIRAILFGVAVVLFALAALGFERGKVGFMAAGLAVFAFPFFWDALAAS
jgi:hypothetical protein